MFKKIFLSNFVQSYRYDLPNRIQYLLNNLINHIQDVWWYGDDRTPRTLTYVGLSGRRRDLRYEADGFYPVITKLDDFEHGGIALIRDTKVEKLDTQKRHAELADGTCIKFEKCLIATGEFFLVKFYDNYNNIYMHIIWKYRAFLRRKFGFYL